MFKRIFSNELFKGSLTLLLLFNFYNFFNFLYHFIGARILGAENYGILATLLGIAAKNKRKILSFADIPP